jgi:hypothetical protein
VVPHAATLASRLSSILPPELSAAVTVLVFKRFQTRQARLSPTASAIHATAAAENLAELEISVMFESAIALSAVHPAVEVFAINQATVRAITPTPHQPIAILKFCSPTELDVLAAALLFIQRAALKDGTVPTR